MHGASICAPQRAESLLHAGDLMPSVMLMMVPPSDDADDGVVSDDDGDEAACWEHAASCRALAAAVLTTGLLARAATQLRCAEGGPGSALLLPARCDSRAVYIGWDAMYIWTAGARLHDWCRWQLKPRIPCLMSMETLLLRQVPCEACPAAWQPLAAHQAPARASRALALTAAAFIHQELLRHAASEGGGLHSPACLSLTSRTGGACLAASHSFR